MKKHNDKFKKRVKLIFKAFKDNSIRTINKIKNKFIKKQEMYTFKEVLTVMIFSLALGLIAMFCFMNIITGGNNITLSKDFNKLIETYNTITSKYYGDIDKNKLIDNAIAGMLEGISDPYTAYSDTDSTKLFLEKVQGNYSGIGCEISMTINNEIIIVSVFDNSPAKKSGLQPGDIIIGIDGKSYVGVNYEEASNYIKNKTTGTIKIKVKRNDEEKDIELDKATVNIPSVYKEIYEKNNKKIGYIYISIFSGVTDSQFFEAINNLEKEKIDSLIIDVRGNSGGYLNIVTNMLNDILEKDKVIYQLEDKNGTIVYKSTTKNHKEYPIAVLINESSASASEILAVAIKESYNNGTIIGVNSYGKATVQQTLDLPDGSMIKYTIQKWLTPNGNWLNEVGVEPDIKIELSKEYYLDPTAEKDNQLQKALEIMSNK